MLLKKLIYLIIFISVYSFSQEVTGIPEEKKGEPVNKEIEVKKSSNISIGLSLTFNNKARFSNSKMTLSTNNYSGIEIEYEINNSYLIYMGYNEQEQNKIGYNANLFYFPNLNFSSISVSYQGQSQAASTDTSAKFSGIGAEGLINYKVENILLMGGINYVNYNFTPSPTFKGKSEISSNIGVSFGLSFFPKDKISIDFFARAMGVKLKNVATSGDSLDTGFGYLNFYSIGTSYNF